MKTNWMYRGTAAALILAASVTAAYCQSTESDVQIMLDDFGTDGYFVASFTPLSANVAPTGSTNLNPALNLQLGKRYRFTYTNAGEHPFEVAAKGVSFDDTVLLSRGGSALLESDTGIGWLESGNDFYFTLNGTLADALQAGGKTPGYRCQNHPVEMRGDINIQAADSPLLWPNGTETFESAPVGMSANSAISGWAVVDSLNPAQYSAEISSSPAGHTNQTSGSTRWLTITDTEDDAGVTGRTYSNAIVVPGGSTVGSYTFSMRMNVQSVGTVGPLIITQHRDGGSAFRNTAGLRVTATGVEAVILGTDGGNHGKPGADATDPLYSYTDVGGFDKNSWVQVEFEFDLDDGVLRTSATGSGGSVVQTAEVPGLSLQALDSGDFRLCIRNNGAGNTSVISYDEIIFEGTEGTSSVRNWNKYD